VGEEMAEGDPLLAVLRKFREVGGDGVVELQAAAFPEMATAATGLVDESQSMRWSRVSGVPWRFSPRAASATGSPSRET
jgi:hypothetical protein